jgi:hypothetical protein
LLVYKSAFVIIGEQELNWVIIILLSLLVSNFL